MGVASSHRVAGGGGGGVGEVTFEKAVRGEREPCGGPRDTQREQTEAGVLDQDVSGEM